MHEIGGAKPPIARVGGIDLRNEKDGHRLMALVFADDPKLRFKALGAQDAMWNTIRWTHFGADS